MISNIARMMEEIFVLKCALHVGVTKLSEVVHEFDDDKWPVVKKCTSYVALHSKHPSSLK